MQLYLSEARLHVKDCHTRLPFRFGIHTLTDVPLCELALTVADEQGRTATGRSSDLLVPKWFRKDPATTPRADSEELLLSIIESIEAASGLDQPATTFETWLALHAVRVGDRTHRDDDTLVRGFGVSMLERALIDGACRLAGVSLCEAIGAGLLGFRPDAVHPELSEWRLAPVRGDAIDLRHTVGLLDPIRRSDIADRIDDGLPECLEDDITTSGLRWFKLKVGGDVDSDRDRLRSVIGVVDELVGDDARFTLDGNEQYADLDALVGLLGELDGDFKGRIVSIEQPLPRATSMDVDVSALASVAPVIIDEADADPRAFDRALACGYRGVSVKNCKGVFQALCNRGLCEVRGNGCFQSGEDLTNLASIPLQQDLVTMSLLGLSHVERNGHHYFRGLDHLPGAVTADLLSSLPRLYDASEPVPRLRVEHGQLDIGMLHAEGFGGHLGSIETDSQDAARWLHAGDGN